MDTAGLLDDIAQEVTVCALCKLHFSRKNAVPGEGPADSDIMLIGEGPGFHENEHGRPFIGAAGKFLAELLQKIGYPREEVFITNVVKCRPPGNRDPQPEEIETCNQYLARQINVINPKVIVTLGRFSMAQYFPNTRISAIHGQAKWIDNRLVVAMYHPAAALHQPKLRQVIENDFAKLPGYIEKVNIQNQETKKQDSQSNPNQDDDATQLSLF